MGEARRCGKALSGQDGGRGKQREWRKACCWWSGVGGGVKGHSRGRAKSRLKRDEENAVACGSALRGEGL